ncbi:hypothetical protein AVEN_244885-1 [Araneus ventricosus]|uniref:Uncharacterized protein n=1 Tax=Araneus ventricosus TaxID=182803 RepID=A0A4Y2I6I0_ARAVE|nr:hypothetical protein AVEN_31591-1 [Araneus ventricosus]GBM73228.1 hypothetical protein AVEN_76385-1 [Araneus ventricosus]GBM73235.1 hypothetical protein AVEN_88317-1 [Araneus ventricosus]GBM73273.1 hypothetical protein AVEN_244885-1 [Araneus ventricosus]
MNRQSFRIDIWSKYSETVVRGPPESSMSLQMIVKNLALKISFYFSLKVLRGQLKPLLSSHIKVTRCFDLRLEMLKILGEKESRIRVKKPGISRLILDIYLNRQS